MHLGPDVVAGVTTVMPEQIVEVEEFIPPQETQSWLTSRTPVLSVVDDLPPIPKKKPRQPRSEH